MKSHTVISVLMSLLLLQSVGNAQTIDEIPIKLEKLSDSVTIIRIGENYITNVTTIASSKGLVVIDTNNIPSLAPRLREMFEREFGRKDFAYVINTHWHWDHTNGNFAFPEATIIGHDRTVAALREFEAGLPGFVERRREWITNLEKQSVQMSPDHERYKWFQDIVMFNKILMPELEKGITIVPPNLTFRNRLTVNLGDKTLQLVYFGKAHTDTDILIYAQEEKLLFVGDLFAQGWLPYIGEEVDIPGWLKILGEFLDDGKEIRRVVTGHHQFMTGAELREQYDYIKDLWEGVAEASDEGLSLEDAQERFSFEKKFSHLSHLTHAWESQDYHLTNVENIWKMLQED